MKKIYEKPRIYVEKFELMDHIASCSANEEMTTVPYRDGYSCTYTEDNVTVFYSDHVSACTNDYYDPTIMTWEEYLDSFKPQNGGGCYNTFSNGNFFAS